MPETLKLLSKCPVTGEDLERVDLTSDARNRKCLVRCSVWTTGVFSSLSKADKWVKDACETREDFLAGAEVKSITDINAAGQKQRKFLVHNPSKNWSATKMGTNQENAWFVLTGEEDFAPPKLDVVHNEEDDLTPDDDATSGFDDKVENPGIDEILADGRSKKARAENS